MVKGYTIDCNYIIPVAILMKNLTLPSPRLKRPRRKYFTDSDGSILPVVYVEVE